MGKVVQVDAHDDGRRMAVAAGIATAVLWGTTGTVQELGASGVAPAVVAATRNALGGVGLIILVLATGRWVRVRRVLSTSVLATLIASFAMGAFAVGYLTAVRYAGVGIGTLATIGGAPVWAGLLGWVYGRRPARLWWVATATTVAGATVLLLPGTEVGTGVGSASFGVLAGLVAGLAYATFATASKRLFEAGADPITTMAVTFAGSGLLLAPVMLTGDTAGLAAASGVAAILWLGLVTIVGGYVLFAHALDALDAPTVATLTLAEPLTAAVLGVMVLAERPTLTGVFGALLIAVGLTLTGARPASAASSTHAASHGRAGHRTAGR